MWTAPATALVVALLAGGIMRADAQQAPEAGEPIRAPAAGTISPADTTSPEESLGIAIRAAPGDAALRAQLGELLLEAGRHAEAYTAYSEAVSLDPGRAAYRRGLGSAALTMERLGDAEIHFAWGSQLDPTDPAMQIGLGEAALARGHPELAAPHFRRAIELSDTIPEARAQAEALLLRASQGSGDTGRGWPGLVRRGLFYVALITMSTAGLVLAFPIAEGLMLLVVMGPVAALRRKKE